jgi:hypothetical protein
VTGEATFHEPFGPEYVRPAPADCPGCPCCSARLCQRAQEFVFPDTSPYRGQSGIPCQFLNAADAAVTRGCPCTEQYEAKNRARTARC